MITQYQIQLFCRRSVVVNQILHAKLKEKERESESERENRYGKKGGRDLSWDKTVEFSDIWCFQYKII